MTVRTRKPTGIAGWPNLIIEGMEKRGKTTVVLRFTADPRVGACYVIEVGEKRADEYAALGNFEIVEHNGTLTEIVEAIRWVLAQPPLDGRPNVFILDTGTGTWDKVKRRAEGIARSSAAALRILAEDPNAEITVGHQAWNKAKDAAWWLWLNEMRGWPGIGLIVCRADEVSKFQDGKPVVVGGVPQMDYRVEIEGGSRFMVDGQVRVLGPTVAPRLVTIAKLGYELPVGGVDLPLDNPLGHLVFDIFEAGTTVVLDRAHAVPAVISACRDLGDDDTATDDDPEAKRSPAKIRAGRVWRSIYPDVSPTEFDADAMRVLLEAVAADYAAETAPQPPPPDAGTNGADDGVGAGTGESGASDGAVADPAPPADPPPVTHGGGEPPATTPGADDAADPGDDGAHDLDDATLDRHDGEPSTVMDDPEAEAEAFACAHVEGMTKTRCVAELALRQIAASVRGTDVVALRSQLADIIVEERLGKRPPPSGLTETAPPTAPVARQETLA